MMPLEDALDVGVDDVGAGESVTVPLGPLAQLRRWLADALAHLAEDVVQDLLLICTELVANAYDHACQPYAMRLRHLDGGRLVRVEVDDGSPDRLPLFGRSTVGESRGRGLVLVDTLTAHRWGVEVTAVGKTVWAELPTT